MPAINTCFTGKFPGLVALTFLCLACVTVAYGQNEFPKWGKVSKYEIDLKTCNYDPEANAIILSDRGDLSFGGSQVVIHRHRRLKILKDGGMDHANIKFEYYGANNLENLVNIKAQTINVQNGKLKKIKVESSDIFEVDLDDNYKEIRFTFPAVEVGSIIEYSYTMYSQNYTFLEGWRFQNTIPTLLSGFEARVPESLDYRILFEGNQLTNKYGKSAPVSEWVLSDLPAIKPEPYATNIIDYIEKIRFQLAGYTKKMDVSGISEYVTTMTTWEKLAKERLNDSNYSSYLRRPGKAKEVLSSLIKESDNPREKLRKIYHYVTNTYRWNNEGGIFADQPLNSFLDSRIGNAAEINLLLTLLLKEAGFDAAPVLLSTTAHGRISKSYPFISQFNYLVSSVVLYDEDVLIDGTEPLLPYNALKIECLNGEGYRLDYKEPRWVKIKSNVKSDILTLVQASITPKNEMDLTVTIRFTGYDAYKQRISLSSGNSLDYLQDILTIPDLELLESEVENKDSIYKPLEFNYKLHLDQGPTLSSSMMYIPVAIINPHSKNPFSLDTRQYPVDFGYPVSQNFIIVFELPENYEIVEMPKNIRTMMPDNLGSFDYIGGDSESKYQLKVNFKTNQSQIPVKHYFALREFYNLLVSKFNENLVLKRI